MRLAELPDDITGLSSTDTQWSRNSGGRGGSRLSNFGKIKHYLCGAAWKEMSWKSFLTLHLSRRSQPPVDTYSMVHRCCGLGRSQTQNGLTRRLRFSVAHWCVKVDVRLRKCFLWFCHIWSCTHRTHKLPVSAYAPSSDIATKFWFERPAWGLRERVESTHLPPSIRLTLKFHTPEIVGGNSEQSLDLGARHPRHPSAAASMCLRNCGRRGKRTRYIDGSRASLLLNAVQR